MNERTMYFGKETAERLPSESQRRQLLCAEVSRLRKVRDEIQKEIDDFIDSAQFDELFDEKFEYYCKRMNDLDDVKFSIARTRDTISRLDAGETLVDIYKSIFG